jgi:hypothetical protein
MPEESMKSIVIGLLFMGGVLMAQDQETQPSRPEHLSEDARVALRSQSPSVKTHSKKNRYKAAKYTVTENKSTIVATRTYNGDK